jgi:hypothetical protein
LHSWLVGGATDELRWRSAKGRAYVNENVACWLSRMLAGMMLPVDPAFIGFDLAPAPPSACVIFFGGGLASNDTTSKC